MFDNVLAIIPARKGSKRLPGKNKLTLFNQVSLWENTVNIAKDTGIKNIIVSSDDNEILDKLYPKNISDVRGFVRSTETSGDDVSTEEVIREVLQHVHQTSKRYDKFDIICLLQPTSPLLYDHTLKRALNQFYKYDSPCLVAVNPQYKPCGAFYIFRRSAFDNYGTIWMPGLSVYVVSDLEAIDIDNIWDLRIAEAAVRERVIECVS